MTGHYRKVGLAKFADNIMRVYEEPESEQSLQGSTIYNLYSDQSFNSNARSTVEHEGRSKITGHVKDISST